ncbi:MAG: hypothetical protein IPO72_18760 [Saprospiraceae bacterium]|nr:hypothetical protein [Candidatus Vicinibacter affinis]
MNSNKVEKNEIRMASCEADQDSEREQRVGGNRRGLFPILLNGLKGLADDGEKDGVITLQELVHTLQEVQMKSPKLPRRIKIRFHLESQTNYWPLSMIQFLNPLLRNRSFLQQVGICPFPDPFLPEGGHERTSMQKFFRSYEEIGIWKLQ